MLNTWILAALMNAMAAAGTPAQPDQPPPPAPNMASPVAGPEKFAVGEDAAARLTLPVMINGQGPFPFVIDTGADRTVISRELATTLNLPDGPHVFMHESAGVDEVPTAVIAKLDIGKRSIERIEAPTLPAADLGAMGMLGIDSLRDQHIVLDFKAQKLMSSPSHGEAYDPSTIVVRGKSRFGQLILVDAVVRGVRVYVILDSGAQNTVGNLALRRLLTRNIEHDPALATTVVSVTGRETPAEIQEIGEAHIGGLTIRNMPLAFAELHTFNRFDLADKPALLLGMDVLSICQKVTVDFKRREATFTLN